MKKNIITKKGVVKSTNDFELSIYRHKDVEYKYSYPDSIKLKGIVFIIPGFGDDTNSEYSKHIREYIAKEFSVLAIHVSYHCFYSRLENGADAIMDDVDFKILSRHLIKHNLVHLQKLSIDEILQELDSAIDTKKKNGAINQDLSFIQTMTLAPKYNEYQNFGVMQAIDHINVALDIKEKKFDFDIGCPTILMGSSHGGYISYLITKFAPNMVDYVIDNSSYVKPPLQYIIGKDENISNPEYYSLFGNNIIQYYFVKTHWTNDKNSFYHFSADRYKIRDLQDASHLSKMSQLSKIKTKFVSYHSSKDKIAPIQDKIDFYEQLNGLGFESKLNIINDESDVDGSFIKSLEHGLNMSLKQLANIELPKALQSVANRDHEINYDVLYKCDTVNYEFKKVGNSLIATQTTNKNIEEIAIETYTKNIEYFKKNQNDIYNSIASFDSALEQSLYQNKYNLIFKNTYFDVQELDSENYLYGEDSNKFSYDLINKVNNNTDKFIFFGTGLGLHITSIDTKIKADEYLILEDDLELFKLSMFTTKYYALAQDAKLTFSIFDDENIFLEKVTNFLSKNDNEKIDSYSMLNYNNDKKLIIEDILN